MFERADEVFGLRNYVFQQDGAPCHTAMSSKNWMRFRTFLLKYWPANSCDLNVIENILGLMKRRLNELQVRDLKTLRETVQEIWDNLNNSMINSLVEQFYHRLVLVLMNSGESIQPFLRREGHLVAYACPPMPDFCEPEPPDDLILGFDVPSDLPVDLELNPGPFTLGEDQAITNCRLNATKKKWKQLALFLGLRN